MSYEYYYILDKDTLSVLELHTGKIIPDLNALSHIVDVSHLTFRDLFKFVIKNEALKSIISVLAKCNIDAFMAEFNLPGNADPDIESILISRVDEYITFINHTPWSESWINVTGKSKVDDENYALSGLNISTILDLPIVVNNYVTPSFDYDCDKARYEQFGPYERGITLEEILRSLFYEISWFGTPENRDDFMGNLTKDVKKFTDGQSSLSSIP